jgi:hypothetical protein
MWHSLGGNTLCDSICSCERDGAIPFSAGHLNNYHFVIAASSPKVAISRDVLDAVIASLKDDSNSDDSLPSHFALINKGLEV